MRKYIAWLALALSLAVAAYGANETADMTRTLGGKPVVAISPEDYVLLIHTTAQTGKQVRRVKANQIQITHDQMTSALRNNVITTQGVNTTAADGARYVKPYNSVSFSGTPEEGMFQVTPTGPRWYGTEGGITDWHPIGGASTLAGISDFPVTVSGAELGTLDGMNQNIRQLFDNISSAGRVAVPAYNDSPCNTDQWAADLLYHYDCVETNLWKRFAYGTWDAPAPDTLPNSFTFTDQTGVALNTEITSAPITVTGITGAAPITVTGGSYDINSSGVFVTTAGTVANNDTVRAKHTSSASNSEMTNTTVTIGGVSDTFSSTTLAATLTKYASQTTMVSGAALNDNTSRWGVGLVIDSATPHTVKKIRLNVRTVTGNPSYLTYKMRLYTRNGTALDSVIAESTDAVTGISGAGFIEFNFAGSTLAQGNVAVVYSTDPADGANFINIGYNTADTDGTYSHLAFYNNSGAQYLDYPARDLAYEIYE